MREGQAVFVYHHILCMFSYGPGEVACCAIISNIFVLFHLSKYSQPLLHKP
jgi:hypothetical protein